MDSEEESAEIFAAQDEDKRQFDALVAQDPVVKDALVNFEQAREALNNVRTAQGFYPVVAMVRLPRSHRGVSSAVVPRSRNRNLPLVGNQRNEVERRARGRTGRHHLYQQCA